VSPILFTGIVIFTMHNRFIKKVAFDV